MKVMTTKLKRSKYTRTLIALLFLPILAPLGLVVIIGNIFEVIFDFLIDVLDDAFYWISEKFKFEQAAENQCKTNPDKFKL